MEGKDGQRDVEYREKRAKQEQQGRARSCFQVQGQTASSSVKHVHMQNGKLPAAYLELRDSAVCWV
jgi:hypothetical protein